MDGISIDKKTAWEDLVKNVLKIIDKERISFEPCNLPDDKNAVVIADRTAADIWQEIEKMDIGFRKYLTEYVGKRLNNYLSTIFDDVKIKNGKKGKNEIKYFIAVLGLTGILSEEMLVWIILRHADCVGGAVDNLQQQLSKIGALDKVSRETVFRIMFALQISLDDAREWLCYGFGGDDFDPRNLKEVIYCYALANNIHYKTKDEKVTSVELEKSAVINGINNARLNSINNIEIIEADCTEYINKELPKFDVVIMDPPRKGSTPEFLSAIKKIKPSRLVYISCDPATLARDLEILSDTFNIEEVQPVDMFSRSFHVETIVCLRLKEQ